MKVQFMAAVALCAAAAAAFATWEKPTASSSSTVKDISCGGIAGTLALHQDWSHSTTSSSATSDLGKFGAKWSGFQYLMTIGISDSTSADVTHKYTWKGNGAGGSKISVVLTSQVTANGACSQSDMSDPSWWWDPTVVVSDTQPQVKRYDSSGNLVATHGFATVNDGYDHINASSQGLDGMGNPLPSGASGSGTQGAPATPGATVYAGAKANPGGATSGSFDAKTGSISYFTGQYVQVEYSNLGSAASNCDNASVWQWDILLESTLTSTSTN